MEDLTPRQRAVLEFIAGCVNDRGYAPTVREISRRLGARSPNAAIVHLRALERKGYLDREEGKSRALRLVDTRLRAVDVPLVRQLKVGSGLLSGRNIRDTVRVDRLLVGPADALFLYELPPTFEPDLGFEAGDLLFVRRQTRPVEGAVMLSVGPSGSVRLARWAPGVRPPHAPSTGAHVGVVLGVFRNVAGRPMAPVQ